MDLWPTWVSYKAAKVIDGLHSKALVCNNTGEYFFHFLSGLAELAAETELQSAALVQGFSQ